MIIVTDTGAGHSAKAYPVKHFVGAWKDGHCRMVFPNEAPPHAVPFNFPLGRDGKMLSVQEWVDSLREEPIGDLNTHNSSAESLNNASFQKTHGVSFHGIAGADESYQVDNISEQANCENAISMSNQAGDELSGNINGGLNVHSRPGAPGVDLMGVSQQVGAPGVDLMSISQQHSAPGVDLMSVSQQPSGTCEDMMGTSRSDFSGIGGMAGFPFSVEHSIGDFAEGPGFIS